MDKIKSILNPGAKADNDILYGQDNPHNLGKLTGEGTHFGHPPSDAPITSGKVADESLTGDTGIGSAATADPKPGPTENQLVSDSGNDASSTTAVKGGIPGVTQESTSHQTSDDANAAARTAYNPIVHDPKSSSHPGPAEDHSRSHAGEAAAAAGVAGVGGLAAAESQHDSTTQEQTTNPQYTGPVHKSALANKLDPRVKKIEGTETADEPEQKKDYSTGAVGGVASTYHHEEYKEPVEHGRATETSETPEKKHSIISGVLPSRHKDEPDKPATETTDTSEKKHSGGILGGILPKKHDKEQETVEEQPESARKAEHSKKDSGVFFGIFPRKSHGDKERPDLESTQETTEPTPQHHMARNAELGAAAVGAAGAAYAGKEHHDHNEEVAAANQAPVTAAPVQVPETALPSDVNTTQHTGVPKTYPPPYPKSAGGESQEHHLGRDAAIGAGAAGTGVGGYEATKDQPLEPRPVADRVPTPLGIPGQYPLDEPTSTNLEPEVAQKDESHLGRNTAIGAGGLGAGALGYEAYKHHEGHEAAPGTAAGDSAAPAPPVATSGPISDTSDLSGAPTSYPESRFPGHGVGTGPSEAAYSQPQHDTGVAAPIPVPSTSTAPTAADHPTSSAPYTTSTEPQATKDQEKKDDSHFGRDAAIGAGAIGAAGYAAHEYSERDQKQHEKEQAEREQELEKERKEHEKKLEKERKAHDKAIAKEEKKHEKEEKKHQKEIEKEEKKHQKEIAKEEKKQQKEIEKEEKKHHKEIVAAEKQHEKEEKQREEERKKEHERLVLLQQKEAEDERKRQEEAEKARTPPVTAALPEEKKEISDGETDEKGEKKKKHGILGILHRKKDKDSEEGTGAKETKPVEEDDSHKKEAAVAAAAGAGLGGAAIAEHKHDDNIAERERALERERNITRERESIEALDSPIKDPEQYEKEKKHGFLGGILHRNKDKDTETSQHTTDSTERKQSTAEQKQEAAAITAGLGGPAFQEYQNERVDMKDPHQVEQARRESVAAVGSSSKDEHHEDTEKKHGLLGGLLHKNKEKSKDTEGTHHVDEGKDTKESIAEQKKEAAAMTVGLGGPAFQEFQNEKVDMKDERQVQEARRESIAALEESKDVRHHGLLGGILHRHKDKNHTEESQDEAAASPEQSREATVAPTGATTEAETTGSEHSGTDRHRLHKDAPEGYYENKLGHDPSDPSYTSYAEPPTSGYASQVTGGTGTTRLAQGEPGPQGSHLTAAGNKLDPNVY